MRSAGKVRAWPPRLGLNMEEGGPASEEGYGSMASSVPRPAMQLLVAAGLALAATFAAADEPKADPGAPVVFRGRVVDPQGRPVARARLYLPDGSEPQAMPRAVSGPDGSYRFEVARDVARGALAQRMHQGWIMGSLVARADGFGPAWVNFKSSWQRVAQQPGFDVRNWHAVARRVLEVQPEYVHELRLVEDRPVVGRVVDAKGQPVAGASVEFLNLLSVADGQWGPILDGLKDQDSSPFFRLFNNDGTGQQAYGIEALIPPATTDAEGRFRLAGVGRDRVLDLNVEGPGILPARFYILNRDGVDEITRDVRARFPRTPVPDGYTPEMRFTSREGENPLRVFGPTPEVDVNRARTVSGVVRAADTGEPLARIPIYANSRQQLGGGNATTDARGRFTIVRYDSEADFVVRADTSFDSKALYLSAARKVDGGQPLGDVVADLTLRRGVVVTGRATEAGTGGPIPSAGNPRMRDPGARYGGYVFYRPLASNAAIRNTPTGIAFEPLPDDGGPRETRVMIDGDGRFHLLVPPGPGALLLQARPGLLNLPDLPPVDCGLRFWDEAQGLHRPFRYAFLTHRAPGDGGPLSSGGDGAALPGLCGPIRLDVYHAYRVIDPPQGAREMTADFDLARGPARLLRFVDPDGRPIRGVAVRGLLDPRLPWIKIEGSEAEALGLDLERPRKVLAVSRDGRLYAEAAILPDPAGPATIAFKPAATIFGRLVDEAGRGLGGHGIWLFYDEPGVTLHGQGCDYADFVPRAVFKEETEFDGRFRVTGIVPGIPVTITFQEKNPPPGMPPRNLTYRPELLRKMKLQEGTTLDLGDFAVAPAER